MRSIGYASVLLLAGLVTAACGSGEGTETAANEWYHTWDEAVAVAEETGKPLLIDMYADWCGPCVTLGEEYFPSEEMQPVLSSFVLLKLDVDTEEGGTYAQRYGVSAIPCVVIARADGTEIDRIVGTTPTVAAYVSALEDILAGI